MKSFSFPIAFRIASARPSLIQIRTQVTLREMTRMEFIETLEHLGFSVYSQVRVYVEGKCAAARRMKQYLLRGSQPIMSKIQEALKWIKELGIAKQDELTLMDVLCALADDDEPDCECGYYDFWHAVMGLNGHKDMPELLAKICTEGRGDRFSTLVLIGNAGTGKTILLITPMILILREKAFIMPSGGGSYLLSGVLERHIKAFLLDEFTLKRAAMLFGRVDEPGWFKALLQLMTSPILDVPVPRNRQYDTTLFQNSAPLICSTTHKLILEDDDDTAITEDQLEQEQEQLSERVTYVKMHHKIRTKVQQAEDGWEKVKPCKACARCFSRIMAEGRAAYAATQKKKNGWFA